MEDFIRAIPSAASSPYAFAAYAIAGILFIYAGARLRTAKLLIKRIDAIPEAERRRAFEIATGTVLPTHISPAQWIRYKRLHWRFLLAGSLLIAIFSTLVIAILNPTAEAIEDLKEVTQKAATDTQIAVQTGHRTTSKKIDESTEEIVGSVQDAALANLETMFPLAVRIERDVDGTIMHLDGRLRQRLVSYDNEYSPMQLYWGDRFHYIAYRENGERFRAIDSVYLDLETSNGERRLPLLLEPYSEQKLRIPGSSPQPMAAYFHNPAGVSGVSIKITIYSSDRERGREEFRKALLNTTLGAAARRVYLEAASDGIRLRKEPSLEAIVLRTLRKGTYVKVIGNSDDDDSWCEIRLPEGREGWTKCELLAPIAP